MEFFTKINIPKSSFSISHQDKLMLTGSCFTENIGQYLSYYQFKTNINPFGIVYNPVSIFKNLKSCIDKKVYTENDLLLYNELYLSLDHHGKFSGTDKNEVLANINDTIEKANNDFNESEFVIITLGTAFVYRHLTKDRVVANCHKIPNTAFEKQLLTIEEIKIAFNAVKDQLNNKTVLFTVSPVRHWRDGALENQRSKSILIESVHQLMAENSNCFYFPAYELMMDELRDYRFYAEDMIHPNSVAVKYIWQRFGETFFNENTTIINTQVEKVQLLLQHRIKNKGTDSDKSFELKVIQTVNEFKNRFPDLRVNF